MNSDTSILSLQPAWLEQVKTELTDSSALADQLLDAFLRFFTNLNISIIQGNTSNFDALLEEWSQTLTESDLSGNGNTLPGIIARLSEITHHVIATHQTPETAIASLGVIFPILIEVQNKAVQFEINARVAYYQKRLATIEESHKKSEQSKSGFIAIAAHELKTPLTIIDGYTSMLSLNLLKKDKPLHPELLIEGIQKGIYRLRNLIDDMIDVSLIETDLLELNYQKIWLNRIIEAVVFEFQKNISERKLVFEVLPFPGYETSLDGDPERLLQLFRNIISNAVKYTPDGGTIQIHGRNLPGFIEISITDNGIGIDPDDQIRIFNIFSQTGNSALHSSGKVKFKGGGPGLGLFIAKGIVEMHGGTMWVDSCGRNEESCPGTSVHILLPSVQLNQTEASSNLLKKEL